jgi:hypothetical protein
LADLPEAAFKKMNRTSKRQSIPVPRKRNLCLLSHHRTIHWLTVPSHELIEGMTKATQASGLNKQGDRCALREAASLGRPRRNRRRIRLKNAVARGARAR